MRRARVRREIALSRLLCFCLVFATANACSTRLRHLGQSTTEGVIEALDADPAAEARARTDEDLRIAAHEAAEAAVEGASHALGNPELKAHIASLVDAAVREAFQSALGGLDGPRGAASTRQPSGPAAELSSEIGAAFADSVGQALVRQLGPDGQGELGRTLASTAGSVSGAAVASIGERIQNLAPGCRNDPDPLGCVERRVQALGSAAGEGVIDGMQEALPPWSLLLAGGGGLLLGLAISAALRRRPRHELSPSGRLSRRVPT
jgi:hypothetical protein